MQVSAIPVIEALLAKEPNNYAWPYLLAYISYSPDSQGDDKLREYIDQAYRLKPDSLDVLYLLAEIAISTGDMDTALSASKKAAEMAPENAAVRYLRGLLLLTAKRYEESKTHLLKAMGLAPESAKIRASLLQLSKFTRIAPDAIPSAETASNMEDVGYTGELMATILSRSLYPRNLSARAGRAMYEQRWADAADAFALLKQHYDLNEKGMAEYANALTILQRYDEAEAIYRELIADDSPGRVKHRLGLAQLLFMNRKPEASVHYEWIRANAGIDAEKALAYQGLARIAASQGKLEAGRQLLLKALKLDSDQAVFHLDLMRIYADLRDFGKAFEHLATAETMGVKVNPALKARLQQAQQANREMNVPNPAH